MRCSTHARPVGGTEPGVYVCTKNHMIATMNIFKTTATTLQWRAPKSSSGPMMRWSPFNPRAQVPAAEVPEIAENLPFCV